MVKNGWKLDVHPHDPIRRKEVAIEENNATIQSQPEPKRKVGRPPKADSGVVI